SVRASPFAGAADATDSSQGRANTAPAPRSTDRRVILSGMGSLHPDVIQTLSLHYHCSLHYHRGDTLRGRWRGGFQRDLPALAVAERSTHHHFPYQRTAAILVLLQGVGQTLDCAAIAVLEAAAEGVTQHLSGQVAHKVVLPAHEDLAQ